MILHIDRFRAVRNVVISHCQRRQLPVPAVRECVDHACKCLRCGKSAGVAIAEAKSHAARMVREWVA